MRFLQIGIVISYGSEDGIRGVQVQSGGRTSHFFNKERGQTQTAKGMEGLLRKRGSPNGSDGTIAVSLTIVDLKGVEVVKNLRGKRVRMISKPSPRAVVQSLGQLTVTYMATESGDPDAIFSNFDPLNSEIIGILNALETF